MEGHLQGLNSLVYPPFTRLLSAAANFVSSLLLVCICLVVTVCNASVGPMVYGTAFCPLSMNQRLAQMGFAGKM